MTSSSDNFTYSKGKREAILVLLYTPKLLKSHQDKDLTISLNTKLHKKRCVVEGVTFYLVSCFTIITLHEKSGGGGISEKQNCKKRDKMKPLTLLKGDGILVKSLQHHQQGEKV